MERDLTQGSILKIDIPVAMQDGCIQVAFTFIAVIANHRGLTDAVHPPAWRHEARAWPGATGWPACRAGLFHAGNLAGREDLLEGRLVENGDTQLLGLRKLGTRLGARYHIARLFGDAT